jgi:aminopeptidase N
MTALQGGQGLPPATALLQVWGAALADTTLSPAYQARLLALPALRELIERQEPLDPRSAAAVWAQTQQTLGKELAEHWRTTYAALGGAAGPYSPDPVSSGRRALRNLALGYLLAGQDPRAVEWARAQYHDASNMTECLGALNALLQHAPDQCADLLADFHARWHQDPLVLDRWFGAQASAPSCTVDRVRALMALPDFSLRNPNRARSVIFRFCMDNPTNLHTPQGYDFWAEQVLALDQLNPEIAARLARAFDNWARHEAQARAGMQAALHRVREAPGLSRNVHEIVAKALAA